MPTAAEDLVAAVRLLVDDPKAVTAEAVEIEGGTELRLRVAESDRGKVIGRHGRAIDALRALADVRGGRDGCRYELELDED